MNELQSLAAWLVAGGLGTSVHPPPTSSLSLLFPVPSSGTNGVSMPADYTGPATSASPENLTQRSPSESAEGTHTFEVGWSWGRPGWAAMQGPDVCADSWCPKTYSGFQHS